ncbi:MAG: hypothetical protein ACT4OO_01720 [Nitrospiraceae bacterium]
MNKNPCFKVILILLVAGGCATTPAIAPAGKGKIHYIQIRDHVMPKDLYVTVGDEVRWQNLRSEPVNLGVLDHLTLDRVSCEKGFKSFGQVQDLVTIAPSKFVSLCFSQPATIRYNVWMDPNDPRGTMSPTSTIRVSDPSTTGRS